MSPWYLVMAQCPCVVGDISGNVRLMVQSAHQAVKAYSAAVIVFPELSLCGYPPEDLLWRPDFRQAVESALQQLPTQLPPDITVIIGHPRWEGTVIYNSASAFRAGQLQGRYDKQHLPNYGVFDEKRYFTPGCQPCLIPVPHLAHHLQLGITICEDIWQPGPVLQAKQAGANLIVTLNASPFHQEKAALRESIIRQSVQTAQCPVIYVNLIGGQDELVFEGESLAMNCAGEVVCRAPAWEAGLYPVTLFGNEPQRGDLSPLLKPEASIYQALVFGIRDYVLHNGFKGALIGLSGGIDSALTLALAVDALGAAQVMAVMMPSRYTAAMSVEDATLEAQALGVQYEIISIEPMFQSFLNALAPVFAGAATDVTEENIQARCRGIILMALSNKQRKIVLTTGNKSEMAVGYATLYGDMAGGFAPLKDVYKTWVYRLAEYRNRMSPVIPQRVLTRAPSAELAFNQTDQDSLPPYSVLDAILQAYIEQDQTAAEIAVQHGFDMAVVQAVLQRVDQNEYKRRQAPPGIKTTERAFGRDRRYPMTSRFRAVH